MVPIFLHYLVCSFLSGVYGQNDIRSRTGSCRSACPHKVLSYKAAEVSNGELSGMRPRFNFYRFPKKMYRILYLLMARSAVSDLLNPCFFFRKLLVGKRLCKNLKLKSISLELFAYVAAALKTFLQLTFLSLEEQFFSHTIAISFL